MIELVDNRLSTGPNNGSGLRWADIPITCAFDDTSHAQYCKLYVVFFYSAHSWRLRIFTKFLLRQTGRGMHIYSWPIWKMIRQNLRTTSTMLRKAMRMPWKQLLATTCLGPYTCLSPRMHVAWKVMCLAMRGVQETSHRRYIIAFSLRWQIWTGTKCRFLTTYGNFCYREVQRGNDDE